MHVEQHQIGIELAREFDGFRGADCGAHDRVARIGQIIFELKGEQGLVLNQKDL